MKKMIIIGGGLAGLSAGCYAKMNNFDVDIFEMHNTPGGVCTSWRRGDYLFDHCLHWVLGTNETSSIYPIYEELGITKAIEFYYTDRFRKIEVDGKTLIVYTNIEKFKEELLRLFPDEKKAINKMIKLVRFYTRFRPPLDKEFGQFSFTDIVKLLPFMPSFLKLKKTKIQDYFKIFKDEVLREMLFQMFPVKNMPALMVILPLAYFHNHEGGYPLGGSLKFARAIERRYKDLGGKIHYNQKIKRILIVNDNATGVVTENGEEAYGDIIVSACDGRSTLYDMLEGEYLTRDIKKMYDNPSLWPSIISISLGVNRDMTGKVEINNFKIERPLTIGNLQVDWMCYFHYSHDSEFAPEGKSVIKTQIETDYDYWRELYNDRENYKAEKEKVLEIFLDELEKKLPGIKSQIEVIDIATPVTWERYTGNWRGSYQGWLPSVSLFGKQLPKKLPGLNNFYMTGQWVFPGGGAPMSMSLSRGLVKLICEKDKKNFCTYKLN